MSASEAAIAGGIEGVTPAIGALAGAESGALIGTTVTGGPETPVGLAGGIIGAIVGGVAGSEAGGWIADHILPDRMKKWFGRAHKEHPIAFDAGSLASGVVAFKPSLKALGGLNDLRRGQMTKAAVGSLGAIGLGTGTAAVTPLIHGEKPTAENLVMGALQAMFLGEGHISLHGGGITKEQAAAKAKEAYDKMTPEERAKAEAEIAHKNKTGMFTKDKAMLDEVVGGNDRVVVYTPEQQEAAAKEHVDGSSDEQTQAITSNTIDKLMMGAEDAKDVDAATPVEPTVKIPDKNWDLEAELQKYKFSEIQKKKLRQMSPGDQQKSIENKKAQMGLDAAAETTAAIPIPKLNIKPADERTAVAPEPQPHDGVIERINASQSPEDIRAVTDSDEVRALPPESKAKVAEAADIRTNDILKEQADKAAAEKTASGRRAKAKAAISGEQQLSETSTTQEDRKRAIAAAAERGTAVATFDHESGKVIVFPKGVNSRINLMRSQGYSEKFIKQTLKTLIAHEEIHGAVTGGEAGVRFGQEYHDMLSAPERWAMQKMLDIINPSGGKRSEAYLGHEAFRMRMQDIMGMTPDDIAQYAGTERLKLDTIYAMQKGLRLIRENFMNRGVKGRAMAMVRTAEIKMGMAERTAVARTSGLQMSETSGHLNPYEDEARHQEDAAAEYRAAGDNESAVELEQRAQWLRTKYIEKSFRDLQMSETTSSPDLFAGDEANPKDHPTALMLKSIANTKERNIENEFLARQLDHYRMIQNPSARDMDTIAAIERRLGIENPNLPFSETRGKQDDLPEQKPARKTPDEVAAAMIAKQRMPDVLDKIAEMENRKDDLGPGEKRLLAAYKEQHRLLESGIIPSGMSAKEQKMFEIVSAKTQQIHDMQDGIAKGDYSKATDVSLAPAPQQFTVEHHSDRIASEIVDDVLTSGRGDTGRMLDVFVRRLKKAISRMSGVQVSEAQTQNLAINSLFKKVASLDGAQQAKLLNVGIGRRDATKGAETEEKRSAQSQDKSRKGMGKFRHKEEGGGVIEEPHKFVQTRSEFVDQFVNQPEIFQYQTLKEASRSKEEIAQFFAANKDGKRTLVDAWMPEVTADTEGRPIVSDAVHQRQDVDLIRSKNQAFLKRLGDLFVAITERIIPKSSYVLEKIKPEHVDFNGTDKGSGITTFHEADNRPDKIQHLTEQLTDGWQRTTADRTASRRVAVMMDKASGRVFLASVYARSVGKGAKEARIINPMLPKQGEYMSIREAMQRYRFLHSILLETPALEYSEAFKSYSEFSQKFMADAQNRQMHVDSYMPAPMTESQAVNMMGGKSRMSTGKLVDRKTGISSDARDPMAIEKIKKEKQELIDTIKNEFKDRDPETISDFEKSKHEQDLKALEEEPDIQQEADSFDSSVTKGGSQSFDPSGMQGGVLLRGARGELASKHPMSATEAGTIYDRLTTDLSADPSSGDVFDILRSMATASSPLEKGAIGKIGRAILYFHAKTAREHNADLKRSGVKGERIEPYPQGDSAIRAVASDLHAYLNDFKGNKDGFSSFIAKLANAPLKTAKEKQLPTARQLRDRAAMDSKTQTGARELSVKKTPRFFQTLRKGKGPQIPEGTAPPKQIEALSDSDHAYLKDYIETVSQPGTVERAPVQVEVATAKFASARTPELAVTTKGPMAPENALDIYHYKSFENWSRLLERRGGIAQMENRLASQLNPNALMTFEGEGGLSFSETTSTVQEGMARIGAQARAFMSRRRVRDVLSTGIDAATTMANNLARKAVKSVNNITAGDKDMNAAIKAVISARGIETEYRHTTESTAWMVEEMGKNEQFKLAKAMVRGDKLTYQAMSKKIGDKVKEMNAQRAKNGDKPIKFFLEGKEDLLGKDEMEPAVRAMGLEYFSNLRKGLERQAINLGILSHDGATYGINESGRAGLASLRKEVQSGLDKSASLMNGNLFQMFTGRKWNRAAKSLMAELDYADANWKNPKLRDASVAAKREFDRQFDLEKKNDINVEYDPEFIPGRYDASFWNNDSVTFGEVSILGHRTAAGKTFTTGGYYEAIGAGPYIPLNHDITALLEHRVRQGMGKIERLAWEDTWKNTMDEHTGMPIAAKVKTINKADIADVPNGIDAKAYTIINGTRGKIAVLKGYDGLYKTLTEPSALQNNIVGRAALRSSQVLKHLLLGADIFHLGRILSYSMSISGKEGLMAGRGFAALEYRPEQIDAAIKLGKVSPETKAWLTELVPFNDNGKPTRIPRLEVANRLQRSGLNVGQIQDALFRHVVDHVPIIGWYQKTLFDRLTRGLMTNNAMLEFERIQNLYPTMKADKILKTVARDTNIYFGNIGKQGWIKSATFQNMASIGLLAPQWVEGIIKKDFAIPYKLATGLHNKQAIRLLTGKSMETSGRAIARGLGAMFVMTQLINVSLKGKPTWENEDKEHKWDAFVGYGVYLNPLSLFNEMLHDFVRYNETKPKVWDILQQIGANKMSIYGRAAAIMAIGKSSTGEYLTSTGAVLKEVATQIAPIPITGKSVISGGRLAQNAMTGSKIEPKDWKQIWSTFGLKTDVGRTALQRMQTEAMKFAAQHKNQPFIMTPTDEPSYGKMRHLIGAGDAEGAKKMLTELRKKTSDRNIINAMRVWERRPLTGSHAVEAKWVQSMDDQGRLTYREALLAKQQLYQKWVSFFSSTRE